MMSNKNFILKIRLNEVTFNILFNLSILKNIKRKIIIIDKNMYQITDLKINTNKV